MARSTFLQAVGAPPGHFICSEWLSGTREHGSMPLTELNPRAGIDDTRADTYHSSNRFLINMSHAARQPSICEDWAYGPAARNPIRKDR